MASWDWYQQASRETYQDLEVFGADLYPILGLVSETGELAGKYKKLFRDNGGQADSEFRESVALELGDVLWYLAQLCTNLGLSLEEVAEANIAKIQSRRDRGTLSGSGDLR